MVKTPSKEKPFADSLQKMSRKRISEKLNKKKLSQLLYINTNYSVYYKFFESLSLRL